VGDYLPLLRELASIDPPAFIFGGIAEDALLNGEIDSSHEDVDLLVPRDQLGISLKQLGALGFGDFAVYYEPPIMGINRERCPFSARSAASIA
jgi:hypothetical protein